MEHQSHIFPFLWVKGETIERIKEEIKRIKSSGIDEFVVESRTHPHFLEEQWWIDFRQILDYASQLDMKVWLLDDAHFPTGYANGAVKNHPHLKKNYLYYSALDLYSEGYELSVNLDLLRKPKRKWSDRKRSEAYYQAIEQNEIEALVAYPLQENNLLSEAHLDLSSYMDQSFLNYSFPKGVWRLFVVYKTTENGGDEAYIDMLQAESVKLLIDTIYEPHYDRFKSYFGTVFRGFFSDEPGFGNATGFARDEIIGQKDMALPWSQEVADLLKAEKSLLPLLWKSTLEKKKSQLIRLKYMDIVTDHYSRNFSQQLGAWCQQRGVQYIGHIIEDNNMHARLGTGAGHYFKAMEGQTMAGIDIISSQISIGGDETFRSNNSQNDGVFYQYCLPKLADSAAQLDPNKQNQAFCELYGAYGWQLSSRNMKWIMDSLLARGITNFVPHAFSMAAFPDLDSPPHFYANGFNPQFPLFTKLMEYMGKSAQVLSGGKLQVKVAILYHAELEWLGDYMKMQLPSKVLSQAQIDFLYLPTNWLNKVAIDAKGFSLNGHHFEKIVIPRTEFLPASVYDFIQELPKEVVLFVDAYPQALVSHSQTQTGQFDHFEIIALEKLAERLSSYQLLQVSGEKTAKLAVRHQVKEGQHFVVVHNESLTETYHFSAPSLGKAYCYDYDLLEATYRLVKEQQELAPYEMRVYLLSEQEITVPSGKDFRPGSKLDFSGDWEITLTDAEGQIFEREPSRKLPLLAREFPTFSGKIRYRTTFYLDRLSDCQLRIERLFDGGIISLNGQQLEILIAPPYQIFLKDHLQLGENELIVEVPTTADRQLTKKKILLNQFEPMEPIGIVGKVELYQDEK